MKIQFTLLLAFSFLISCRYNEKNRLPEPIGEDEVENLKKRKQWFEAIHRAAPGTDWKSIELQNAIQNNQLREQQLAVYGPSAIHETFANGALTGNWVERGPRNIAGSARAVDYDAATNNIYTITDGGSLWRGSLAGNNWTLLNDDIQFQTLALKVFTKIAGGRRILLNAGERVYWSDDEGATLTQSSLSFPVAWGGNYVAKMIVLNDAGKTIYLLTHNWDNVLGWGPRHYLWRSTDQGQTFTRIHIFTTGNDDEVSMCQPYNSNAVYVTDISSTAGRISLFEITGTTVTAVNSSTVVTNGGQSPLTGVLIGNTITLYLLQGNGQLYKRVNTNGVWTGDWQFVAATPTLSWNQLDVAIDDANKVYYGEVDAYRSTNGGANFTRVNVWSEYYNNIPGKLHADMMAMLHFKRTDNTIFQIVNNHGGVAVSYDGMVTTSNLSITGLYNAQSYDILTDTINPNIFYNGTQDQGVQRTDNTLTPGIFNATQFLSGDYGHLVLTNNNSRLWAMYPGIVHYFVNPLSTGFNIDPWDSWQIPGANIPNAGWMPPVKGTAIASANEVYVAGGNVTGGGGSYLIKLQASLTAPVTFTPQQINYDFRANSNNGSSGISALEVSQKEVGKLYVATEDGSFFYSNNNGTSWNKTPTFNGATGWFLYGQTIVASKRTNGLVWYGGSGYSNPAVFKSTDGGASFAAMNNGLPQTLVHEIAANADESMLFAATDAGPYVYVVAANQWFPMIGAVTPAQMYTSVEFIRSSNTVRFGTYGRGVFDFNIITGALPVTGLQLTAKLTGNKVYLNWKTLSEDNNSHFDIERNESNTFVKINSVSAIGNGNSVVTQTYQAVDEAPANKTFFYRIKQVDKDGKSSFSNVVKLNSSKGVILSVLPNPVISRFSLSSMADVKQVQVFSINGVLLKTFNPLPQYNITDLPKGNYIIRITMLNNETQQLQVVKQ
jgi:hypothetical protein